MAGIIVSLDRDIFHRALLWCEFKQGLDNLDILGADRFWNVDDRVDIITIAGLHRDGIYFRLGEMRWN